MASINHSLILFQSIFFSESYNDQEQKKLLTNNNFYYSNLHQNNIAEVIYRKQSRSVRAIHSFLTYTNQIIKTIIDRSIINLSLHNNKMKKINKNMFINSQVNDVIDYATPKGAVTQRNSLELEENRKKQLKKFLITLLKNSQARNSSSKQTSTTRQGGSITHFKTEQNPDKISSIINNQKNKLSDNAFHKKQKLKYRIAKQFNFRSKIHKNSTEPRDNQILMQKSNEFFLDTKCIDQSIYKQRKSNAQTKDKKIIFQKQLETEYPFYEQNTIPLKQKSIKTIKRNFGRNKSYYHSQPRLQPSNIPLASNLPIKISFENLNKIVKCKTSKDQFNNKRINQQQSILGSTFLSLTNRDQYYAPKVKSSSLKKYYGHEDSIFIN